VDYDKLLKLNKPPDFYHPDGYCAFIARSSVFFTFTMGMILLNAIWIGIDAEFNTSATLLDADAVFIVGENIFCIYFAFEILVRFGAFKKKRDCSRDAWFVFDGMLVVLMVIETWIIPVISQGMDLEEMNFLRTMRLIRLTRLGRIVRLLRMFPELMTLLKGIATAMRSVCFTLLLLFVLIFVFGVIFKVQAIDTDCQKVQDLFPSLFDAMWTLFLHGTLLDTVGPVLNGIRSCAPFRALLFVIFIFLSSFTVMNMLIGILCDVVSQVSQSEKEEATLSALKAELLDVLECHDVDDDRSIGIAEFELLMRNPEVHRILERFSVNGNDMISLKDVLFEERNRDFLEEGQNQPVLAEARQVTPSDGIERRNDSSVSMAATSSSFKHLQKKLSFAELLSVVLRLRGGNTSTVTDIVDLREYMRQRFDYLEANNSAGVAQWQSETSPTRAATPDLCFEVNTVNKPGLREGASCTGENGSHPKSFLPTTFEEATSATELMKDLCSELKQLRTEVRDLRQGQRDLCEGQRSIREELQALRQSQLALAERISGAPGNILPGGVG